MQRAISTSPAAGKPGGPRARWSAHSPPTSARACPRSAPCLGARRGWPFGAPDQESVISARQYKKIMDTIEYNHRVTKTARTHAQTHSTTNKTHTHTHTHTHTNSLSLSHTHTFLCTRLTSCAITSSCRPTFFHLAMPLGHVTTYPLTSSQNTLTRHTLGWLCV